MPKSVNKVILLGNLGKDPEVKYTPNGVPVAKFSIATNESYKDKGGEWQERTEWHNIVAWQRLAEIVGEYLKKGSKVYIEGRLQTSSWEDKQSGEKKYRTEIVAHDLVLLSGRGEADSEGGRALRGASLGASVGQRAPQQEGAARSAEITDEDIPF
jgi:single-strand DNA-binding protein